MSTKVHLRAVLNPKIHKYIVTLGVEGKKSYQIKKIMSSTEFVSFVRKDYKLWDGPMLSIEGDDGTMIRVAVDNVQKARIREYLELVLESGQQSMER